VLLIAESDGECVFVIRLRDLWQKQWNVDVHNESCIRSLYDELEQLEHAKQSQQSPVQVPTSLSTLCQHFSYLYLVIIF